MPVSIPLGPESRVAQLFAYPNSPTVNWSLSDTVLHWFRLTLKRDGLEASGATASVVVKAKTEAVGKLTRSYNDYTLVLDGPKAIQADLKQYQDRFVAFLNNGWEALTNAVPKVFMDGRWDPSPDPQPPVYHTWRFFLPLGMALLKQRALLFFHYPPIRLLETNQDYLDDPVPVRCEQLLLANGMSPDDVPFFNTVLDATPIGAEDAQGSKKAPDGKNNAFDPEWGPIPINYFHDYQKAQVQTLLNPSPKSDKFTVPIVVFGSHPLQTFKALYGIDNLTTVAAAGANPQNAVTVIEIVKGRQTPVIASDHPYKFYAIAQIGKTADGKPSTIGAGAVAEGQLAPAKKQMLNDLVVMRWLKLMADDSSQDPMKVLKDCQAYWADQTQDAAVTDLTNYQGSLLYSDPATLAFSFKGTRPACLGPDTSSGDAAMPVTPAPSASKKGLQVIGDSGKPVDWWFMYKVSGASKPKATGNECVYFDSTMAKDPKATLALAKKKIDDPKGALLATLAQAVEASPKDQPKLGWFTYNDEDHQVWKIDPKTKKPALKPDGTPEVSGTGPSDRGHCKGCLAFDLETNTAFWLIHSVPLFPIVPKAAYPGTGYLEAQTLLCIQLKDASVTKDIAQLMFNGHGPNVNLASDFLDNSRFVGFDGDPKKVKKQVVQTTSRTQVPDLLAKADPKDPRLALMRDQNGSVRAPKPFPPAQGLQQAVVEFTSAGGMKFKAMAKNKAWGLDFYDDLVGVVLGQDLEVETWEDTTSIPPHHKPGDPLVIDDYAVDLSKLGTKIPFAWSEKNDHAKLAISDRSNSADKQGMVCVGDINFTIAQEKRGGGTVAFNCPQLWKALSTVLAEGTGADKPQPPAKKATVRKTTAKKAATKKTATKKVAAKKAAAKSKR